MWTRPPCVEVGYPHAYMFCMGAHLGCQPNALQGGKVAGGGLPAHMSSMSRLAVLQS